MSIFESVISIFAPHNCICCGFEGSLLCDDCWSKFGQIPPDRCFRCFQMSPHNQTCKSCKCSSKLNHVAIRTEYKGIPKVIVQLLKYHRTKEASKIIAKALAENYTVLVQNSLVVAIPTASSRVRQRGYDQSVLIAKQVAKNLRLPHQSLLLRLGQTRQVGTKKSVRQKQMINAFRPIKLSKIKDSHIILIDDVMTTGSTMESAASALKKAGAKTVDALVFSRVI